MPRPLSNPDRREPSNKSNRRQPRKPSREEDHDETMSMLAEPKKNPALGRDYSNEKEPQTAQNNSFLARREALQNRLKKKM